MRIKAGSLLLLATGVAAIAAGRTPSFPQARAAYERAQIGGDRAALKRLLSDDYLLVNGAGEREGKRNFISELTSPNFKLQPDVVQRPVLRTWRDGAVVAGTARQTGVDGASHFDACIRFVDVWALRDDRWQVVLTQVARAAPPSPTGCPAQ